jgi:SAM-dependent methyltransferase
MILPMRAPHRPYGEDLAFVHDVGFGGFTRGAAPGVLKILAAAGVRSGRVVDLGCGSGIWAERLVARRYEVLGIDVSEAMIRRARRRVPAAEFRVGSLFRAEIPPCDAVTSLGECIGYLLEPGRSGHALSRLFRRVHAALAPGGVFVFDLVGPGELGAKGSASVVARGEGWLVAVDKDEDRERGVLTRRITTFRKVGRLYRRSEEIHRLRLHAPKDVLRELRNAGFRARAVRSYGALRLPPARAAFVARKPARRHAAR